MVQNGHLTAVPAHVDQGKHLVEDDAQTANEHERQRWVGGKPEGHPHDLNTTILWYHEPQGPLLTGIGCSPLRINVFISVSTEHEQWRRTAQGRNVLLLYSAGVG